MSEDDRLTSERFPRASGYNPDWILAGVSGGANPLWLTEWWRRHWERSGILEMSVADTMPDGWRFWLQWLKLVAPANEKEVRALETDAGQYFGYVRAVGRRRNDARLFDPLMSLPAEYTNKPLLRSS